MPIPKNRLACTLESIDQANRADPNQDEFDGQPLPKEFVYSQHMTRRLFELEPAPSEFMQIACRAQHIERWTIPRNRYPEGREGYYQWRIACGQMHGQRTAEIMMSCGYPVEDGERVAFILTKRKLRNDKDTQLLEDVACMVFLERYFAEFYEKYAEYDQEKWLRIIRRTWEKMTPRGHKAALTLASDLPPHLLALLQAAVL